MRRLKFALGASFLALASPTLAQPAAAPAPADPNAEPKVVDFAADTLAYNQNTNIVTATGNVILTRDDYRLRANEIVYDRNTGIVEARGDVVAIDPGGNQAFGDHMRLTDSLKDGAIDNILVVLQDGGRLAAVHGTRTDGVERLDRAVYSPCEIDDESGCPKAPLWQIKAVRVVHDPKRNRIFYKDAWLEVLGMPVFYIPAFSHPDGKGGNSSGLLVPNIKYNHILGAQVDLPVYFRFAENSDLTVTPSLFTDANPAIAADYRLLTSQGPIEVGGAATYSNRFQTATTAKEDFRGYFYANGRLQHTTRWRSTFGVRLTSDDTYLRRYDISRDDVLRNFYALERFGENSYFSAEGWAFQSLRQGDRGGTSPIVLPTIDYRWRPDSIVAGGRFSVRANLLAITRTDGEDVQRGIGEARWDATGYTGLGQRITSTVMLRADAYNVEDAAKATDPAYAGKDGWHARAIPVGAVDVEWPFAGPAFGGIQTITPRVQFVVSPGDAHNDVLPNEDARAIDLDDNNLFSLNRFPGFDRWEGGGRVTYGGKWTLDRPNWRVSFEGGQSYRLNDKTSIFPVGTGLSGHFSDFVGRDTLRIGNFVDFTHRFRLDKETFAVKRNEIDLTLGSSRTYATFGYVRLNRDIQIEDLEDREEIRAGGRVQLTRYWSVIASAIVDLTSRSEDPLNVADGFDPIRHRLGIAYEDECFQFELTWRRDYTEDRDFRQGNTYMVRIAFKNLGR